MLALAVYPYMLHSLSYPGAIQVIAEQLEPDCTISSGSVHYMIEVTYGGETESYGGAGSGTANDLYSRYVEKLYMFDGSSSDYDYNGTLDKIAEKYKQYQTSTEADMTDLKSALSGEEFDEKTKGGMRLQVATEGGFSYGKCYTYVTSYSGDSDSFGVEDVWVDGRYISIYNQFYEGVKFGDTFTYSKGEIDTSKSDILIRNMTFTDYNGDTVTRDVLYSYDSSSDTWRAPCSYTGSNWYYSNMTLPDSMILTQDEVEEMVENGEIDGNTDKAPESGLIYDGTVEPGTSF